MTNQEKQKLNEKLVRWAGNINHDWTDEVCGYKTTECFCENCHRAEDYTPFPCVPGFTDSLDSCFKWLVPKLDYVELKASGNYSMKSAMVKLKRDGEPVYAQSDSLAEALCLAIEKLIEVME